MPMSLDAMERMNETQMAAYAAYDRALQIVVSAAMDASWADALAQSELDALIDLVPAHWCFDLDDPDYDRLSAIVRRVRAHQKPAG